MASIEAHGLRKTFGTTVALDGIDLKVDEGRILGLIGPNGAGKSTALNAILGLTAYQGEEIQHILTDVMFIHRGRIVLDSSMEDFETGFVEVMVHPEHAEAARALKPLHERQVFGRSILLFRHADRTQLEALGEIR